MVMYLGPARHSPNFMDGDLCRTLLYCGKWLIWKYISQDLMYCAYVHCYLSDLQFPRLMDRGWRFFMIKLWNHSLLDARTMNACNTILQGFQDESTDLK